MLCIVTSRVWRDPAPGVEGGQLLPVGSHDAAAGAQLLGRQRLKLHLACPQHPLQGLQLHDRGASCTSGGPKQGLWASTAAAPEQACIHSRVPPGVCAAWRPGNARPSPRLTTCAIHQGSRRGSSGSVGSTSLAIALFTRHTCARGPTPGMDCHPIGCQQSVCVKTVHMPQASDVACAGSPACELCTGS